MFDLTGKVAIVTGGSSGIGAATLERFRAAGAIVVNLDISEPATANADHFLRVDVSDPQQIAQAFDEVIERFGCLDILVNNAGIAVVKPFEATDAALVARLWQVNALGVLFGMQAAATRMKPGGVIVNNASYIAHQIFPFQIAYAMSKAAAVAATKAAAIELAPRRIRVNCVCPGAVVTPLSMAEVPEVIERTMAIVTPAGRPAQPGEIAAAIHFLASDDASYVNGQALIVDGGWSAGTSAALALKLASAS